MNRRTFLASTSTGLVGLGTGIVLSADTANAQADVSMGTLDIGDKSTLTEEGYVEEISCTVSGKWSYELPGGNPSMWIVQLNVSDGDVWHTIGESTGEAEYNRYNSDYTVSGSLIQDGPFNQSFFAAPGPGKQTTVDLPFQARFKVVQEDETVLANTSIEDTAAISIGQEAINASLYGELKGTGSIEITT